MTCRKARRAERLAILVEIESLNRERCCDCSIQANSQENNSVCKCPAATRIRELGERLLGTTPRRVVEPEINADELNAENYKRLKEAGVTDQLIAKHFGMGKSTLSRWKKNNDLLSFKTRYRNQEELDEVTS